METQEQSDKNPTGVSDDETAGEAMDDNKVNYNHDIKFLQIEDSTLDRLPVHAERLLNSLLRNNNKHLDRYSPLINQTDLLMALIYCVALETGFASIKNATNLISPQIPSTSTISTSTGSFDLPYQFWGFTYHSKFVLKFCQSMPDNYHDKNLQHLYKLKLYLINFSLKECLLTAIQTGEFLLVTLSIPDGQGKSVCLSIPRYILSTINFNAQQTKFAPKLFRNLKELSHLLKENILIPTRNCLMDESNKLYPGLIGLPIELLNSILNLMQINDIQNLSKTCWKMRCYCVDFYETKCKPSKKPFGSKHSDTSTQRSLDIL